MLKKSACQTAHSEVSDTSDDDRRSRSSSPANSVRQIVDNIRLCSITRAHEKDTYDFGLIYHERKRFHRLEIRSRDDNKPSNAVLAGVKNNDRLIEINDESVDRLTYEDVVQYIRATKYPQPLRLLVASAATYDYYKQRKQRIHSGLPTVQKLLVQRNDQLQCLDSSSTRRPIRRQYQLRRNPASDYGFNIASNDGRHRITDITPQSPAEYVGLRVGDMIVSVNNKNVEHMSRRQFIDYLKKTAKAAESTEEPLLLDVSNDDSESFLTSAELSQSLIQSASAPVCICQGDLVRQNVDVIVVCSSSKYLVQSIRQAAGAPVINSYHAQVKTNPKESLVAIQADGEVVAKRIYFLPWTASSDASILCASVERFVSISVEQAAQEKYTSIAFPAIGCGNFGCSIGFIARTMVEEAHRQSLKHQIQVTFVIQPGRVDIYEEFRKEIELTTEDPQTQSIPIGNGVMEVAKGDLTRQKVDVIIGSSSSGILLQRIFQAAGPTVRSAYDTEWKNRPQGTLVETPGGDLWCKRIFFVKWKPNNDDEILRQSLVDLISLVVQSVRSHRLTSVAFPAIGCGEHGCSVDIVVETMVLEMKKHLITRKLPWTVKFIVQTNRQNVYDEFWTQISKTQDGLHKSQIYRLPRKWETATDGRVCFPLSPTSSEYLFIKSHFDQTIQNNCIELVRIERIQNERWYMQYVAHAEDFKKRLASDTEQRLFHGCPEDAANAIIIDGFNRSFAGKNGVRFGFGVYFSSDATYSHDYAVPNMNGERRMFVARVLIGKTTLGDSTMKTRPVGFDSTTDGKHIFVTYHDAQAFAEYLIVYK